MSTSREPTPNNDTTKDRPSQAPSKGNPRPTRATAAPNMDTRPIAKPSKTDIIKDSQSHIKSLDTAKKWLADHEYVILGEELTIPALVMALLYLANGRISTTSQLVNGIRAAAICLDAVSSERGNPDLAKDAAESTLTELTSEATAILSNLAENAVKTMSEVETRCKEALSEVQAHVSLRDEQIHTQSSNHRTNHPSYADILKTTRPPEPGDSRSHRAVVAKEEMIRKQILIDGIEGTQSDTNTLAPKLLVAKANLAIELMTNVDPDSVIDKPKNARIVSAKILGNKGVVFEASNEDTATWLRTEKGTKAFTAGIGSQANLKKRTFHVVVEFVPTSLSDQLPNTLRSIESDNGLASSSIISARWMRAPNNWREDQKSAHAILTTDSILTANSILKDGIVIEGSRLQARKLEEEPKRCFKCQKFSTKHTAANCSEITDWCPNCAKSHSVDECRVKNRSEYACIGCRSKGLPDHHAAWDKKCPSYIEEKTKIQNRHPEYDYKYYLSDEPWTWERKQDNDGGADRWRGNTYESRRDDPTGKYNATRRTDNGWGQRLGQGTLASVPVVGSRGRQGRNQRTTASALQSSQQQQQPRQPQHQQPQPQPQPQPQTQPSQSSQPGRSVRNPSRGTASRTRGRSTSARRAIDQQQHQQRETSASRERQTTLIDWFEDQERERSEREAEAEKTWGNSQPPTNTQP